MGKVEIRGLIASPLTRAVVIICKISGIPFEYKELDPLNKGPEFYKLNPQQQIPVLIDDEFELPESRAITKYLLAKYAKDDFLYPTDIKARVVVDARLDFDNGNLWPKIVQTYKPMFSGGGLDEEGINNVLNTLPIVEEFLTRNKWIAGPTMTIADVFSACIISFFTETKEVKFDFSAYPKIKAWLGECRKLEIFKKYDDEGNRLIEERLAMVGEKFRREHQQK